MRADFYLEQDANVMNMIRSSLYRCERTGIVDADAPLPEVSAENKEKCKVHISGHTILIRESTPQYYDRLTETLDAHGSLLMYVSPNLDVYARYGNRELKEELRSKNLRFGTNMAERSIGTNAVSVCADNAYERGVWTVGEQNYAKALRPYAFYAFAVHAKYNRMCYVALVTRKGNLSDEVASLFELIEATESIFSSGMVTEDVIIKDALFKDTYSNDKTENLLIIIGGTGKITYVNDAFYRVFKTNYNEIINVPLVSIAPELSYALEGIEENAKPPAPRQITFAAAGEAEYHVTCTHTNQQMPGHGLAITIQRVISVVPRMEKRDGGAKYTFDDLGGESEKFRQLKAFAERVAETNCTVMIRGESGTGKELFAHSIHNASDRCSKPFISVNCAAIPRELIGSELFGYVAGAFTGASRTGAKGKFELANGGTLFLDEIAEMPTDMQSVLLRALEEGAITRLGGSKPVPVDVRLIVATNQNLEDYINDGKFRLDLYYRLNIVSLNMIPLREKREDINILADGFLARFSKLHGKPCDGIALDARNALKIYSWPGNVRELRNVIERAVITTDTRFIELHHLPPEISGVDAHLKPHWAQQSLKTADYRKETAKRLMRENGGNKSRVAKKMGIARTTLYRILKECDEDF